MEQTQKKKKKKSTGKPKLAQDFEGLFYEDRNPHGSDNSGDEARQSLIDDLARQEPDSDDDELSHIVKKKKSEPASLVPGDLADQLAFLHARLESAGRELGELVAKARKSLEVKSHTQPCDCASCLAVSSEARQINSSIAAITANLGALVGQEPEATQDDDDEEEEDEAGDDIAALKRYERSLSRMMQNFPLNEEDDNIMPMPVRHGRHLKPPRTESARDFNHAYTTLCSVSHFARLC